MRPPWTRALLVLAAVALLAHRLDILELGFYHDDWVVLWDLERTGSLWATIKLWGGGHWQRPVGILQIPVLFWLAEGRPLVAQGLLLALEAAEGLGLALLLWRLPSRSAMALTAAALALVYPGRPALRFWPMNASQLVAHALVLGSLLAHLAWLERRRKRVLAAGQLLYLASVLCYESTALLPAVLLAFAPPGRTWREQAKALAPYAASLAAALAWKYAGAPLLFGAPDAKRLVLDPRLAGVSLVQAYDALTALTVQDALGAWRELWRAGPSPRWLALPALGGLLAWSLPPRGEPEGGAPGPDRLLAFAALAFAAAYLPFALSGAYTPTPYGVGSRVNGAGAWAFGALCAGLLARCPPRPAWGARAAAAALTVLLVPLAWSFAGEFASSWREQRRVLAQLAPRLKALPDLKAVLYDGPRYAGHAVIFDAPYDFQAALRVATGSPDLVGRVVSPHLDLRPPYEGLYLYADRDKTLRRLAGPADLPQISYNLRR